MRMFLACAGLLAAGLIVGNVFVRIQDAVPGGCESGVTVSSAYEGGLSPTAKYLKANAVPQCPGMVAGVPVSQTQPGNSLAADSPWTETLDVPGGKTITVACGTLRHRHGPKCAQPMPDLLTYQYVPVNGNASAPHSIVVIKVVTLP